VFSCAGFILTALGLLMIWLSRESEGLGRYVPTALGVILVAMGLYSALFETGLGLARWLPWLEP
jgi:sulfite exporter TauE/SafE